MVNRIDVSSTALEKSIELARDFLEKLVFPPAEELGLLLRDHVALWRFKNQVSVLNKAKSYCEQKGISPQLISPKLLCPLLEGSSLEADPSLQDRWAILLSNMVDSEKNVQNHVFPYVLGQMSLVEFEFLEQVVRDKKERVRALTVDLEQFRAERPAIQDALAARLAELSEEIEQLRELGSSRWNADIWKVSAKKSTTDREIAMLDLRERSLLRALSAPQLVPESGLKEFELSNIIRLGLVRTVYATRAEAQSLEIPNDPRKEYLTVDFEVDLESSSEHFLTELGEMFIDACSDDRGA
ncbi:MAG TPA: hypothetical protein VF515_01970 [Candidatus Binatia bacterium]